MTLVELIEQTRSIYRIIFDVILDRNRLIISLRQRGPGTDCLINRR